MNLVLSGPIDESLTNAVMEVVKPKQVVSHRQSTVRFEEVDDSTNATRLVDALCASARVDYAYVAKNLRLASFGLLAVDMDSTLITIECIDELADYAGKKDAVSAITDAAMRGEIADFAESLRRRVALLAGLEAEVLQRVFEERLRLSPGAEQLISAVKAAGLHTLLVSGGFTYFTDRLVESLQLDAGYANRLEIVGGKLTGRVKEPILSGMTKADILRRTMDQLDLDASSVLVIGDGSNDIPMMQCVSHSISYHGRPAVAKAAKYAIRFGSLTTTTDYFS